MKYLILILMLLPACKVAKDAPDVEVCVSFPEKGGMNCRPKNHGDLVLRPYSETEDYIALPPNDFEAMLDYCKEKKAR